MKLKMTQIQKHTTLDEYEVTTKVALTPDELAELKKHLKGEDAIFPGGGFAEGIVSIPLSSRNLKVSIRRIRPQQTDDTEDISFA